MTLAHTLGEGGPEIEILLFAFGMLVLGVVFFVQKSVKPMVPVVLVLGSIVVGAGAFAFGGSSSDSDGTGSPDASIEIVRPEDGARLPANESVRFAVEVTGGQEGGHLHVFVDGELISMPTTRTPRLRVPPGEHTVAIEYTAPDHSSFDPRVIDEVGVTAE